MSLGDVNWGPFSPTLLLSVVRGRKGRSEEAGSPTVLVCKIYSLLRATFQSPYSPLPKATAPTSSGVP